MLQEFQENYLPLIKTPQTLLLLLTGLAGYMTARCPILSIPTLLAAAGSLFLSISGSTILNMWYDRDLDAQMPRTCDRPLAASRLLPREGFHVGTVVSTLGISWALALDPLFGGIVFLGFFFDVVIYTIWLKRRSPWSILWGGISGGMPVLAGRTLGLGKIDWIGVTLALAILFWIPTHILTFSLRYDQEYQAAGIPTFPAIYGIRATRMIIAVSSILAAVAMGVSGSGVGMAWGSLHILGGLSAGLLFLAIRSLTRPSERSTWRLFKYASFYMMGSMLLLAITGL